MHKIIQKRGFETKVFSIDENLEYVAVEHNSLKEKLKYKIDLIELGNEIEYEADNLITGKIIMAIFILLLLGSITMYYFGNSEKPGLLISSTIVWGILVLFGFFIPNKDDILITKGSRVIRMFRNKPDEEQVTKFANTLINLANEKKKSLLVNFDLSEEQFLANIQWLRNMKLIDETESENLRAEYNLKKLI